jgi:hypothetical protein
MFSAFTVVVQLFPGSSVWLFMDGIGRILFCPSPGEAG